MQVLEDSEKLVKIGNRIPNLNSNLYMEIFPNFFPLLSPGNHQRVWPLCRTTNKA